MTLCRTYRLKICYAALKGKTARQIWRENPDLAPSLKTVETVIAYFYLTGLYSPIRFARQRGGSIPVEHVRWLCKHLREEDATLYLDEMRDLLFERFGRRYPLSTLCATLIRNSYTRKVLSVISSRRSEWDRETFRATVKGFTAEQKVFLDETRKAARSLERVHGRGPRGQRVKVRRFFTRNLSGHSALGMLTIDGMYSCAITDAKGVTADLFIEQLEHHVVPYLNRYPGPRSVVILDNARIHHDPRVKELIEEQAGALLVFLPPYSYDLNPIELAFSKVKSWILRHREQCRQDPRRALHNAMFSITAEDAAGYFKHCGHAAEEIFPGLGLGLYF